MTIKMMSTCLSVFCWRVLCLCVSAMVHCHHEPSGDLAYRTHGSAAPRLPAEDPHQDHKGGDGKHPPSHYIYKNHNQNYIYNQPQSFALPYRKSTGTSGCRGSSTPPSTARCTTRFATGSPWRRPRLRWGKEACRASPWRTAMRRTKRTTRVLSRRLPNPRPLCSPEPAPPNHNCPFHHFWLAWLPMHVPTQIATLGPLRQLEMPMKEL